MYQPCKDPVMLVKNFDDVPAKKRVYPLLGQEKYDGVFAYGLVLKDDNRIFSRTGELCVSLKHIEAELNAVAQHVNASVAIFEVYNTEMKQSEISGRFRSKKDQFPEAVAVLHDVVPYEDFLAGTSDIPYRVRYAATVCMAGMGNSLYSIPVTQIDDEDAARDFASEIINRGGEGAVFSMPNAGWVAEWKQRRTARKMKIKQDCEFDLLVTGIEPGEGKYAGTTGKLLCRFRKFGKVTGDLCTVYVSGMTDKERDAWWADPDSIIGCIVLVRAMKISDLGILREPVYKGIRYDKDRADF